MGHITGLARIDIIPVQMPVNRGKFLPRQNDSVFFISGNETVIKFLFVRFLFLGLFAKAHTFQAHIQRISVVKEIFGH